MAGKPYSIKEMKSIVDHLIENKLYSEIKGRKMWMDFANTQLTTRTWQSLKETFLKRILPDVHNPYYRLTMEQINSFRSGYDIAARNKNKLEIHTVSDDSNANGTNQTDTAQSNNGNGIKKENIAGENKKCSKIPSRRKSSADTVIVESCYETAKDIQKVLESPINESMTQEKSLRDCITYSEPLTPMLQEVLDDFQSEPEDEPENRENVLEIVDSEPVTETVENIQQEINKNEPNKEKPSSNADVKKTVELPAADAEESNKKQNKTDNDELDKKFKKPFSEITNNDIINLDSPQEDTIELDDSEKNPSEKIENANKDETDTTKEKTPKNNCTAAEIIKVPNDCKNSGSIPASGNFNNSNNTPDASLPNNPEALKKRISDEQQTQEPVPITKETEKAVSRKRSNSEAINNTENKKIKIVKKKTKAASETEATKSISTVIKSTSNSVNSKQMGFDNVVKIKEKPKSSLAPNLADILEKSPTSLANDLDSVVLTSDTDQSVPNESSEPINPCLQNLSLFDEQFNKAKYVEFSDAPSTSKNEEDVAKKPKKIRNEVIMLKSHTESDTEPPLSVKKKQRAGVVTSNNERERALSNVFGFNSGTSNPKRKRHLSRRRRTISHNKSQQCNSGSDTSGWTSESDSEVYVSPPRSRKNRPTKKYLKPQSGKLLMLEEKGGLFVMSGKKIYPLVKDGKLVKNYVTYMPEESDPDEEEYWKTKYVEEKKKADELKKLLERAKRQIRVRSSSTSAHDPQRFIPIAMEKNSDIHDQRREGSSNKGKEVSVPNRNEIKEVPKTTAQESIKIKFTTKHDQEIHLEGNWPQLHNVLEHVVHIFHKEPEPVRELKPPIVDPPSSSGISSPIVISSVQEPRVDPEVREKVNKIENEIFKEIEDRDKEEQLEELVEQEPKEQEINVTQRRPVRPKKSSQSSLSLSPAKRQKVSEPDEPIKTDEKPSITATGNNEENNVASDAGKRQSRTPQRVPKESPSANVVNTVQTRRSKLNMNTKNASAANEDDEIRYMFPPQNKRQSIKSTTDKNTRAQKRTAEKQKSFSSPEINCQNSLESTQGYQDSNPSPIRADYRRKKRMNPSVIKSKGKSHLRRSRIRTSQNNLYYDNSIIKPVSVSIKKIERDNSTINSDVYKSESYQLLMPRANTSFRQLEQVDETYPIGNEVDFVERLGATSNTRKVTVPINSYNTLNSVGQGNSDVGSSSNMSLPMSPELSVVESMSISRDLLRGLEDGPTINEMLCNEPTVPAVCSQFLMSNIDVSVPLMQQDCGLESSNLRSNEADAKSLVTESLLHKIGAFNINEQNNITEALDIKLRDLLLESAKKMSSQNENKAMDVDDANVEVQKKVKNKKRCSTPRKRKDSQKAKKAPKIHTPIEEEHIESYARGGRTSCPPIIQNVVPVGDTVTEELNIDNLTINDNIKPKGRKKKDIIKVKILKPKNKKIKSNTRKDNGKKSVCTDSGINDTSSAEFLAVDESIDLIHNHSETCLHTNECVGDSVEFVDSSTKSIITIGDSLQSGDVMWDSQCEFNDAENIALDLFCNNARDTNRFYKSQAEAAENIDDSETIFHSPMGTEMSSLLTDDLSDELTQQLVKPNNWYILSEDENTNTNLENLPATNVGSVGANLKQIFPITCAVPDLSTITEMSRENDDNSRKPTLDSAIDDCFNSPINFRSKF